MCHLICHTNIILREYFASLHSQYKHDVYHCFRVAQLCWTRIFYLAKGFCGEQWFVILLWLDPKSKRLIEFEHAQMMNILSLVHFVASFECEWMKVLNANYIIDSSLRLMNKSNLNSLVFLYHFSCEWFMMEKLLLNISSIQFDFIVGRIYHHYLHDEQRIPPSRTYQKHNTFSELNRKAYN